MGRIFNSDYPVRINNDANATEMANKIVAISNGKFSVYSVTSSPRTILLRYLNTNLILEITVNSSDTQGFFGSIESGSYVRSSYDNRSTWSYSASDSFRICYSEIDDTLCCLTVLPDSYVGTMSTTSHILNFTIANTIINNNYYLTCHCDESSNSFFGMNYRSYYSHYTMEGNFVGETVSGGNIMSLNSLKSYTYYSGTALLIPYYFVANAANHTIIGEIQFSGQNGKKLYALLPPTSDGLVDPRENYIINGTSYKACGDVLKLFL